MKYSLLLAAFLISSTLVAADNQAKPATVTVVCPSGNCTKTSEISEIQAEVIELDVPQQQQQEEEPQENVLSQDKDMVISVIGQGVAPVNTTSPAQAYALAKRAATADAYRLIAEKVKGVRIDGQDLIKNMMVQRSTVRTSVAAMVKNANLVETTFKEGLCEVEMEITLYHSDFAN